MAKAIIKQNSGGGLYNAEIVYERDLVDSEIKALPDKIEQSRLAYLDAESEYNNLLAEIAPLKAQLAYEKAQLEINEQIWQEIWKGTVDADLSPAQLAEKNAVKSLIGQYENSISVLEKKISALFTEYINAQVKSQKHEATYFGRLKRQEQLEDFPENPLEALWCLDHTTDIPIGAEVGIVDCAGYAKHNGRNIISGYKDNFEYDMARDGKLHHAFPGFNLTFSYLKFLTFNEGFQRWYPSSRYAVIVAWESQEGEEITELDYWDVQPEDKLAYIRYLPAYSAWLKNSIDPYPEDKHNVPISYMACNHHAFEINDVVYVKFVDQNIEIEKFKIRNKETSQTAIDLEHQKEKLKAKQDLYDLKFGSYTKEQLEKLDTKQKNELFDLTSDIIIAESKVSALEIRMQEIRDNKIEFPDGWAKPVITGFKDHPKPCPKYLFYMGDPVVCKNNLGDVTSDEDCAEFETSKYYRVFDVKEDFVDDEALTDADNSGLALNVLCKPHLDPEQCGHGLYDCYDYDSITYDQWTAHAISWKVINPDASVSWNWAVAVDFAGAHWKFPYKEEELNTWPNPDFPYNDRVDTVKVEFGSFNPVHAFDLWLIESDDEVTLTGWPKGDFVLSICGNKNTLEIWNLTQELYKAITISIDAAVLVDFPSQEEQVAFQNWHQIITLGVKRLDVFFAYAFMKNEKMRSYAAVYKHDSILETCVNMDIEAGHTVVYNPFKKEIWFVNHGEIIATGLSSPFYFWDFESFPTHAPGSKCNTPSGFPNPCVEECVMALRYGYEVGWVGSGALMTVSFFNIIPGTGTHYSGYMGGEKIDQGDVERTYRPGEVIGRLTSPLNTCGQPYSPGRLSVDDCDVYKNWIKDLGLPDAVAITGEGAGEKRTVTLIDGSDNCASGSGESLTSTEKTFISGSYDDDYGVANWPHFAPYSFVKHAYDSSGVAYEDVVVQKNNDGEIEYVGEEGQEIFFTLNTDYDHAKSS